VQSLGDFPCPTCSSRPACQKDYLMPPACGRNNSATLNRFRALLRTSLWHRFQERIEWLQKFGYLSPTSHLTDDGEWARLIRIDHSLLITELIRAEAFAGADPGRAHRRDGQHRPRRRPARGLARGSARGSVHC